MIKKGYKKIIILGILLALFSTSTVFAAPVVKVIRTMFSNVKVYINGQRLINKDSSGKALRILEYKGEIYLPATAVAEALGETLQKDKKENSLYIGANPNAEIQEITVSTPEEFVNALGSNRRILLDGSMFNLSAITEPVNTDSQIYWEEVFDGTQLVIRNVTNLTIEGIGETPAEIVVVPRYAYVMSFRDCDGISIKNVNMGHTEEGYCTGGVLSFLNTTGVQIEKSVLYGCGTEGLTLDNVETLSFTDSTITGCTYGIMTVRNSRDLVFDGSIFSDNEIFDLITIWNSSHVLFDDCVISNNKTYKESYSDYSLFNINMSSDVLFKDTGIFDNDVKYLYRDKNASLFENCTLRGNQYVSESKQVERD